MFIQERNRGDYVYNQVKWENHSSTHDESILLEELDLVHRVRPRQRSWNPTSVSPSVSTATTPSKILAYIQILEPTLFLQALISSSKSH